MQDTWADPGHRASGGFDHRGLENGVHSMDTLGSHCRLEYMGYVRICTAEPSSSEGVAGRIGPGARASRTTGQLY